MHTDTYDTETESGWPVEFDRAAGYSGLYAMILATCASTNTTLETDVMPDISLALAYFVPIFGAVFLLNVAVRASGLAELLASWIARPARLNLLLSAAVGLGWLLGKVALTGSRNGSIFHATDTAFGMITDTDIERWLREDVGHHDVTNQVPGETTGRLLAKEDGTVAGLEAARAVFEYLGCDVSNSIEDGTRVEAGDRVLRVEGAARDVLRGERVAVNLAGHASGIATRTRQVVDVARGASDDVRIAATRKTTPGLRGLEKRAVVAGGGDTHRLDLSHMVMVKDNHVAEMGLKGSISHFRERVSFATKIDVEVETVADVPRAADAGADIVLLDNMRPADVRDAVEALADYPHVLAEASGGITLENVAAYAETGVDVISMGSLTHSAPSLDLSFYTGADSSSNAG